jgi:hypothetical protein
MRVASKHEMTPEYDGDFGHGSLGKGIEGVFHFVLLNGDVLRCAITGMKSFLRCRRGLATLVGRNVCVCACVRVCV